MLVKGIVLDYDGVVLDSFRGGLRKIAALCAMEQIAVGREARAELTKLWGMPAIELLQAGLGVSRALAEELNRKWILWDNKEPPQLVPGTREVLVWLRRNGIKVCLLTSRHRDNVAAMLDRQDLAREFAAVCCREDVPHHKPDPRALRPPMEKLYDEFGIRQDECLFVGDTPSDIECGHRAGVVTLVVQTGPYLLKHSRKSFAGKRMRLENILASVEDLPLWIEQNTKTELAELYD